MYNIKDNETFIYSNYSPNVYTTLLLEELSNMVIYPEIITDTIGNYDITIDKDKVYIKHSNNIVLQCYKSFNIVIDIPLNIKKYNTYKSIDMFKILIEVIALLINYEVLVNDFNIDTILNSDLGFNHFLEYLYPNIMEDVYSEIIARNRDYILAEIESEVYDIVHNILALYKRYGYKLLLPYFWINDNKLIFIGSNYV